MRRFAGELRDAGFEVDYRFADSMQEGVQLHIDKYAPEQISQQNRIVLLHAHLYQNRVCSQ